ncbi:hypothetical protein DF268_00180 [Streptomyces sp. V2]|nr:hypothetical protein DF268_00180 [Streptomyces sp. V2]
MDECGRSYGFVHRALKEAGTRFAPRGGRTSEGLNRRPLQVLRLLADGGTPKTMAQDLGITVNTARFHLTHVLRRTGAGSGSSARPAAVNTAYTTGLLPRPALLTDRVRLTHRQRGLIPLLAQGLTVEEIAATLDRTPRQALAELRELEKVLGARSPAHVITKAWQYGLAPSTDPVREEAR